MEFANSQKKENIDHHSFIIRIRIFMALWWSKDGFRISEKKRGSTDRRTKRLER